MVDLSEGGACIDGTPAIRPGERGVLDISGVSCRLPFAVRSTEDGRLHVEFALDPAATAIITPFVEDLRHRMAAA